MMQSVTEKFSLNSIVWLACMVAVGAIAIANPTDAGLDMQSGEADASQSGSEPIDLSGTPDLIATEPSNGESGSPSDSSTFSWLPPAETIDELVFGADAIVIGTVNSVIREVTEGPFGSDGSLQSPRALDAAGQGGHAVSHPGLDVTYYEVRIDEALLNDGRLVPGGAFELRLVGLASNSESGAEAIRPSPRTGQQSLFVMNVNPDLRSYGVGLWGEIDLSGDQLRYRDWNRSPVAFAEGQSPEVFLERLRAAIAEYTQ